MITACQPKRKEVKAPEFKPEHTKYISAFTSGLVPKVSAVRLRFADYVIPSAQIGREEDKTIFTFHPTVKGKSFWIDRRTIEFRPDEYLESGQVYDAKADLSKIFDTIPKNISEFLFQFHTKDQNVYTEIQGLSPLVQGQIEWHKISGELTTEEFEYPEKVEKVLTVSSDNLKWKVKWNHDKSGTQHSFTIDSVQRKEKPYKVKISWDGEVIRSAKKGERELEIPALGDFKVLNANVYNEPDQHIVLTFSDEIHPQQDLNGLIISNTGSFNFVVESNTVKAFPSSKLKGNVIVNVLPGIKNILGHKMINSDSLQLVFEDIPPQLRLVGDGAIVPNSNGIPFPFEAINLNAVDVQIMKIYESNVLEFLQFNNLSGSSYLEYVGKVVLRMKIPLDTDPQMNLGKWNRHALDLSKLIQTEPGAIYRVSLKFRKDYSLYECPVQPQKEESRDLKIQRQKEELWDYYSEWDYYGGSESPCKDNYFRYKGVTKNILASDLGMIAKRGTDGKYFLAITDLKTTEPLANIPVDFYDQQKKIIKTVFTDNNGFAWFKTEDHPTVAVARKGNQKGYLKLNSSSLSLSKFEVSGSVYEKGLKGFLYTDRGVWRPGDSIYISFILEDKQKVLPLDHPVLFEFYNPKAQLLEKRVVKTSLNGFYSFPVTTGLNAPTGNYLARINVGGVVFEKNIKVETVIPNRLKLNLELAQPSISFDDKSIGTLKVKWLHGAPAGNMNADITVLLRKAGNIFPAYKEFTFDDPLYENTYQSKTVFDGSTDKDGNAEIDNNIGIKGGVSGPLKTDFFCKVFEPGGNFSTDNFSGIYHPFKKYLGVKSPKGESEYGILLTDTEHTFEIASISNDGKPLDEDVTMELYRLEWRWWWDYYDDLGSYNGRYYNSPVTKETIRTKNGKGSWKVKVDEKDYGRYLVRACYADGHCAGVTVYIDYPGWYSRRSDNMKGTTVLSFSSDKNKYKPGEKATLEIPTGYEGRALVTIENGAGIIKADWVKAVKGKTYYSFNIAPEMAPNVYASVMLIQPHGQTANDLPVRMYGVIPISVDNPASHLNPVVALPEVLRPEEKVTIKVSEASGKRMTYTIAMVDEGLLDLTKFKTPDPWNYFYSRQALEVFTWDIFDQVMNNKSDKIKKLLSIGGDDEGSAPGQGSKVQRFKPMVKFIGPFYLESGKTASHSFIMPKYVGSVRTMVVAGQDGAYGMSDKTTPVKKPLMVLATLPRVLGPDEEVMLPVSVFADETIKDVTVEIKANDLLQVQGSTVKQISFSKPGEELVTFPVKVAKSIGVGKVLVTAKSGLENANYEIELDVRPANPNITRNSRKTIKAGASEIINYEAFGIKGTNKGKLELTTAPSMNLEKRLSYLMQYPHGCVEQTTSSVFPQVALDHLMELTPVQKKEIQDNIKAGISRLKLFQESDGGLSYWPGNGHSDEWGTNYAGHFLIEASKRGYNVPSSFMDKWKEYQKKKANSWVNSDRDNNDLIQAYRVYLLALAGSPEYGVMNRMKELPKLSVTAKWYLAGAYFLGGQKQVAETIIKNVAVEFPPYRELSYTYGSDVRDKGIILDVAAMMGRNDEAIANMAFELANMLATDKWMSTQETAYCLLGASRYFGKNSKNPLNVEYKINGGEWKQLSAGKYMSTIAIDFKTALKGKIEIKNNGAGTIYCNTVISGIPLQGNEVIEQKNVELLVSYFDMKGKELNVDELEQGTDFIAEITVSSENSSYKELSEMALSYLFPSGWQVHNPRMTGQQFTFKTSVPEYMDIRDDRIYYYFDVHPYYNYRGHYDEDEDSDYDEDDYYDRYHHNDSDYRKKVFRVAMNASYLGTFYLPSVNCEAMYDHNIKATIPGKWIRVVKRKGVN